MMSMPAHRPVLLPGWGLCEWLEEAGKLRFQINAQNCVSLQNPATSGIPTRTSIGWCRRVAVGRTIQACEVARHSHCEKEGRCPPTKLHPDAQRVCDMIIASGRPPIETLAPVEARAVCLASKAILQPDPEPVAEVKDLRAQGRPGQYLCVFIAASRPRETEAQPVVVYFHGGGWVIGDLESHDQLCRARLRTQCRARSLPSTIGSRRSTGFPAAVEDAMAATRWIADNADRLEG